MAVGGWKLQKHDQADDLCNSYCYCPFTTVIVTIGKTSPWRQEKVAAYVTASVGFLALLHACPCLSLSRSFVFCSRAWIIQKMACCPSHWLKMEGIYDS